ncbi:histidine--tRNA ligase [Candidatus Saccharibacteria bacterium]|nr:histidine--tRNA ligase [Candidatus Saccharibacteria bacterium]
MKKFNTSPISGMQELTPAKQAIFDKLKNEIAGVYHSHGFLSIETPIIDRTEILLAKAGGDTEKQIYKVVKTAETEGDADQALRFDHTVPLARYVVEHENDITFPFKVTQIGRNFRGERAQKGRFREFYQLDVDVIGREKLALAYDAEVVKTAYDALKTFIKPEMKIRISNRKILSGLLQELGLETKSEDIFSIIDHAEKVPKEKTLSAFEEIGLSNSEIEKLSSFMGINGTRETVIEKLKNLDIKNEIFALGVEELDEVLALLEKQGLKDTAVGDMLIIRGLDYYTGSVFETFLPEYREIGSICSGGRYENLASNYTENKFPGVGISIGLTRLFYVLNENNLLDEVSENPIDLVLIPFSENEYEYTFNLAEKLRSSGKKVDINLSDKKVGDKFTYAAKIAKFASVIGGNEVETGNIEVKNLETGEKLKLEDYIR